MQQIVEKYKSIGLSLLPCKQDKSPFVSDTWKREFDLKEFDNVPAIGIKCGSVSGNLECLDIDNHVGTAKDNLASFIEQIKIIYDKYKFPIEQTQNGGYHILWKCKTIEGNLKLAFVPKLNEHKKWVRDAIFETRGEGGYFVAYPSPKYKVIKNDIFNIPTISEEDRFFILNIARSFNTWYQPNETEFEKGEKPGDIYNSKSESIEDTKYILKKHGWSEFGKFGWVRPGKKDGLSATLGKAAENIFYVFSVNAYPFEPESGYTPFQVMGLLDFNGDFKACAKYLAERYELKKQPVTQNKTNPKTIDEKTKLLKKYFIDTDIEIEKPPVVLYISEKEGTMTVRKRLFTLGNFSALTGKAKSRKTFNLVMLTAALVKNGNIYNKFHGTLPSDKRRVLYFDTEQGNYDSANTMKRIERLANVGTEHFAGFNIRELSPIERCEFIENALEVFTNVGFVAIDGVADLSTANNDEIEATRVTSLFLRWTKQYNCHICTVIHQNKNDNFATGHLGSSIMKKAEIVMSSAKDKGSNVSTTVSCDLSRGIDFNDYTFFINDKVLPELEENIVEEKPDKFYD